MNETNSSQNGNKQKKKKKMIKSKEISFKLGHEIILRY